MRWLAGLPLAIILMATPAQAGAPEIAYLGLDPQGIWQVWVMNADGSLARQVTHSPYDKVRVSWYPDQPQLLVNGTDGYAYRVDLETDKAQRIPIQLHGFQDAVLSPDGEWIAFSLSTSGSVDDNNIWLVKENGQDAQKLTAMARLQHEPAWGPNGQTLYFLSGGGGQSHNIWRMDLDSHESQQITAHNAYYFDVAIAPNGTLAYSNNRNGHYDLWIRSPNGEERRLTDDDALDARPSWSPDGTQLVFESTRDGGLDLWLIDIDSGDLTRLTHTNGGARYPVWRRTEGQP